jgi:hypothetical protein
MNTVRHILFYVPLKPGNLMLAEMGDRTLCILQNDELLDGHCWPLSEMAEAVKAFQAMKATALAGRQIASD